jgi:hypothetical protein
VTALTLVKNEAALMTVTGTNAGTYLVIMDNGDDVFGVTADTVIQLVGTVGTLVAASFV